MNAKQMFKWTVLISAPVLLTGLPAFACGSDCPCNTVADAVAQLGLMSRQEAPATVVNVEFLGEQEFLREALESSAAECNLASWHSKSRRTMTSSSSASRWSMTMAI